MGLRTWIEISRAALKDNYWAFRRLLKSSTKIMAVAKSNAYGHNLVEFSLEMERLGADWIGVDSLVEAKTLRQKGIKIPILVLGYTLPEMLSEAAQLSISLTISHLDHLKSIEGLHGPKPKIHLKIDSGMHRQGFLPENIIDIIDYIDENLDLKLIEGVYTHFAAAKDPNDTGASLKQGRLFEQVIEALRRRGLKPTVHASASGGAILFPQFHFDLVRVGIGLYGHYPSKEIERSFGKKLKPALTWKTIISEVKELPKGERIGYDLTERLRRDSRIAICPMGYWHGFTRALSQRAFVLAKGQRCKVLGRVSMDMISVDATRIPNLKVNDEVVLIGKQGKEEISAEELASICGTSNYEFLTRLNPLIQRIYL